METVLESEETIKLEPHITFCPETFFRAEPHFRSKQDVNKDDPVDMAYLGFQKAFDEIPYQRILRKLSSHGITGKIPSSISNWLKYMKRKVGNFHNGER